MNDLRALMQREKQARRRPVPTRVTVAATNQEQSKRPRRDSTSVATATASAAAATHQQGEALSNPSGDAAHLKDATKEQVQAQPLPQPQPQVPTPTQQPKQPLDPASLGSVVDVEYYMISDTSSSDVESCDSVSQSCRAAPTTNQASANLRHHDELVFQGLDAAICSLADAQGKEILGIDSNDLESANLRLDDFNDDAVIIRAATTAASKIKAPTANLPEGFFDASEALQSNEQVQGIEARKRARLLLQQKHAFVEQAKYVQEKRQESQREQAALEAEAREQQEALNRYTRMVQEVKGTFAQAQWKLDTSAAATARDQGFATTNLGSAGTSKDSGAAYSGQGDSNGGSRPGDQGSATNNLGSAGTSKDSGAAHYDGGTTATGSATTNQGSARTSKDSGAAYSSVNDDEDYNGNYKSRLLL